jgi:hypothetical protein
MKKNNNEKIHGVKRQEEAEPQPGGNRTDYS